MNCLSEAWNSIGPGEKILFVVDLLMLVQMFGKLLEVSFMKLHEEMPLLYTVLGGANNSEGTSFLSWER